jgi:23S rRNA (adenine2503-C2)-methyltransferase
METGMKDILDLTKKELTDTLGPYGEKPYRAKQIFTWLHQRRVKSFDEMTDISKALRSKLAEEYSIGACGADKVQISKLDGTRKYLYRLVDGSFIEGVFMRYRDWNTACISSQVGCAMGCRFCASTINGCDRDLSAGEMAEQIYAMEDDTGETVSNVVIMGSGEPLLNYANLMRFIDIISDGDGKGISKRNITVSTCGIVPSIFRLADEGGDDEHMQINLALSLHAPTDEKRRKLMPIAEKYTLSELAEAMKYYYDRTHRRLTFEYALVSGENDTAQDAEELAKLLRNMGPAGSSALVNLIPVNPVKESGLGRPTREACEAFKNKLENFGINGSIRRELGSDIDGACGQLRMKSHA